MHIPMHIFKFVFQLWLQLGPLSPVAMFLGLGLVAMFLGLGPISLVPMFLGLEYMPV